MTVTIKISRSPRAICLLVLAVSFVTFAGTRAQSPVPCSDLRDNPYVLNSEYGRFEFYGTFVVSKVKDPITKQPLPTGRLDFALESIVEVPLTPTNSCQQTSPIRLLPEVPEELFMGPLKARNLTGEETFCVAQIGNFTIAPDFVVEAVKLNFTWADDPDTYVLVTLGLSNANESFILRSFPPSDSTGPYTLEYAYQYALNGIIALMCS